MIARAEGVASVSTRENAAALRSLSAGWLSAASLSGDGGLKLCCLNSEDGKGLPLKDWSPSTLPL